MQSEKLLQILGVAMFERGCGHEQQQPTASPPAITEVAILGAGPRKRGVEAAEFGVGSAATEDVIARQKVGG